MHTSRYPTRLLKAKLSAGQRQVPVALLLNGQGPRMAQTVPAPLFRMESSSPAAIFPYPQYGWWRYNGYTQVQSIKCLKPNSMNFGWYIFESPLNNSYCTSGYHAGGNYYCQIPKFSYGTGGLSYNTATICNNPGGGCRDINSNGDPINGYYIQHNAQDTSTSSISSNSWTEYWSSST